MGLAVERLPLTLHWKKLYISGRSNDNDNLLGIDYGRLTHRGTPAKQRAETIGASREHNQTHLVSAEAQPIDGRSQKQSKEKNGASRFFSLPLEQ